MAGEGPPAARDLLHDRLKARRPHQPGGRHPLRAQAAPPARLRRRFRAGANPPENEVNPPVHQEHDSMDDDKLSFEEFAASVRAKEAMLYTVFDQIDTGQFGYVGR
eukprot:80610-Prorocentrum_minimum.AAC.1